jgi:iron(III) transport system ATP-binding protein
MGNENGFLTVSKIYKHASGNFALQDITFSQRRHQQIAIAGETGSGKSTLLKIIAGLEQPESGEVKFIDVSVKGPADQLVPGHPAIAYLSQDFELPKFLRVEQVLSYSNTLQPREANTLFDVCQISHLLKRKTNELSGGEQQRIALARLLLMSPSLLLLDEPFSNLDMVHKNTLKSVLKTICGKLNITCILVSHDPLDTLSWADKILVMKGGKIIQTGSPKKIYNKPSNEYVAGLFGSYNFIPSSDANLFYEGWKINPKKKNLLVRPEDFKITGRKANGVKGKIIDVRYFGSYYETDVLLGEVSVTVRTKKKKSKQGADVYIRCYMKNVWWVA